MTFLKRKVSAGCIPISGYNVGAQRNDRVKELMKLLLIAEFLVGLAASALFLLFPLSCLNKGTFIFLQSLGKAKQSTALSLMREILFGVGLPLLLPVFMGLDGILLFMPIADVLTAIASVIVIVRTNKELNQIINAPAVKSSPVETAAKEAARTDYIITIGRSYGAGGRSIGKEVAGQLHIPYYDSELLEKSAESNGLSHKFLQSIDEKPADSSMLYRSVGFGTNEYKSIADQARKAQREIIEKVAAEGPCVIVGRSADQVLAGTHKLFRVFISSGVNNRIKRITERDHISAAEAKKKLVKVDRERASYYNQRSQTRWGDAEGYDLCIDTDWFGIDNTSELIAAVVTRK